jgi:YrbI family 3-deoxy-D-manno-octulosonate 8-phosphate phosphatase
VNTIFIATQSFLFSTISVKFAQYKKYVANGNDEMEVKMTDPQIMTSTIEKIVVFIPLRGGSKSIPLKNIKPINERPLAYYALDAAVNCKYVSEVYVATDSEEIKEVIKHYFHSKVIVIDRSVESATDTAITELAMMEFSANYQFDYIVLVQVTCPLITPVDLEKGIEKLFCTKADSLVSCVRQKRFLWKEHNGQAIPINYTPSHRPRRQDHQGFLVENGSFYITSKTQLEKTHCRISGKIVLHEMPEKTYYEIDEPPDWLVVEFLLQYQKKQQLINIQKIKMLAMDCDGVLTDAGMYYDENGDQLKKFNTRDGIGIALLQQQGIHIALITGEDSEIVAQRAQKLGIKEVFLGVKNKAEVITTLQQKYNLDYKEIAYIGDDLNDLPVFERVGFKITVKDGCRQLKDLADLVTSVKGGEGAVREVCDLILEI